MTSSFYQWMDSFGCRIRWKQHIVEKLAVCEIGKTRNDEVSMVKTIYLYNVNERRTKFAPRSETQSSLIKKRKHGRTANARIVDSCGINVLV